jgi:RND family efflux transporter MFP subunit
MNHSKSLIVGFFAVSILFSQCKSSNENDSENQKDSLSNATDEKIEVTVIPLKRTTFYKEIVSNGKLNAVRKADLSFKVSETIDRIEVKNGTVVNSNQLVASLDNFLLRNAFQRAKQSVEKSKLELHDQLIMQGYTINDTAKVPREVLKSLRIKSGYEDAISEMELAGYNLMNSELRAPFAGIIANLESRVKNRSVVGTTFCTIIDNSEFDAEFPVLETELRHVKENQKVKVMPFSLDSVVFTGYVSEINPMINENGMVKVKARVKNSNRILFEGMNVKVLVGNAFPSRLVVPKQAVVIRQGKQVVFTYEDGRAKWNYVKTGFENSTEYTIEEGIDVGAQVIITNNLNLGHDAEVNVVEGN